MGQRPFTAVPATRSSKKALRFKQNLIIGALLLGVLLGPLGFFFGVRAVGDVSSIRGVIPPALPTSTVAFAQIVAQDFLAGRPTSMPVAQGVPQDLGFRGGAVGKSLPNASLVFDQVFAGQTGLIPLVEVRFRVTQVLPEATRVFNLTVPVMRDPQTRKDLLADLPSLTPASLAPNESAPAPVPDERTTFGFTETVPSPIRSAVDLWAKAFAADDRRQLKALVGGGPDAAAATGDYLGLGNFALKSPPETPWAVVQDVGATKGYVRVNLLLQDAGANGYVASVSYDVLVLDWSTPTPRVVAWGAPGAGPTLVPYANNTALQ